MEKGVKLRFSVGELLLVGNHKWKKEDVDAIILRNLEDLCRKVNALGYLPPMYATSCLRSLKDQLRINPKAIGSSHLYGCAVDISDPQGRLAGWLKNHPELLVNCGLWMEDPRYTKGWVHLQSYAPKSMNRIFIP